MLIHRLLLPKFAVCQSYNPHICQNGGSVNIYPGEYIHVYSDQNLYHVLFSFKIWDVSNICDKVVLLSKLMFLPLDGKGLLIIMFFDDFDDRADELHQSQQSDDQPNPSSKEGRAGFFQRRGLRSSTLRRTKSKDHWDEIVFGKVTLLWYRLEKCKFINLEHVSLGGSWSSGLVSYLWCSKSLDQYLAGPL